MKKIINGRLYNTDTAKKVAEWNNGLAVNDNSYYYENLYLKRTGEYFIYGQGNAGSKYRRPAYGDSGAWTPGENIVPVSVKEAQRLVEKHLDADEYQSIFGKKDETGKTVISSAIPTGLYDELEKYSQTNQMTKTDVIVQSLLSFLRS